MRISVKSRRAGNLLPACWQTGEFTNMTEKEKVKTKKTPKKTSAKAAKKKVSKKPLRKAVKIVKKKKEKKGKKTKANLKKVVSAAKKTGRRAKYWEGVGRRKTAVARVRIFTRGTKDFLVNNKKLKDYFTVAFLDKKAVSPLGGLSLLDKFKISVKVMGGGVHAQAEAVRHGLSRALVEFNPNFRKKLKKAGFLTRDPRMKERKKFGLKKARRAAQWQKR